MCDNLSHRASGRTRHTHRPQLLGQVLDEVGRDAIASTPRRDQRFDIDRSFRHGEIIHEKSFCPRITLKNANRIISIISSYSRYSRANFL